MALINDIVGSNIKQIREERGLSLEKLSRLADVSKSMLGQIERGESSPTINVLWKIANGLKIPFSSLTTEHKNDTEKFKITKPKLYDSGSVKVYSILPYTHDQNFEMYRVEIESQGRYDSKPRAKGSIEIITVYTGGITIVFEDQYHYIDRGESFRFKADVEHQYLNDSLISSEFSINIHYKK
jgi:transcriptional regulator with XRE-family HTH domain